MYTNEQTMAWIMDTYSINVGHTVPSVSLENLLRSVDRWDARKRPVAVSLIVQSVPLSTTV